MAERMSMLRCLSPSCAASQQVPPAWARNPTSLHVITMMRGYFGWTPIHVDDTPGFLCARCSRES